MAEPEVSSGLLTPAEPLPSPAKTAPAATPWRQVLRAAWLSIALGLLLELVLVLYALASGQAGRPQPFLTDLVQKVSWGLIVCVGVAFGTTAAKAPEAKAGLLGLIAAPLGFLVARSLHKALSTALGVVGAVAGVSPFLIGGLKGVQYGLLGAVLAWLGQQTWGRLGAHLGAGLAFGVTFGLTILLMMEIGAPSPTPPVGLVSRGLNELIFPVGCAAVIYTSNILGRRL
jgi:formate/nitrite transporter FocA (FNT family)